MKNLTTIVLLIILSLGLNTLAQNAGGSTPFWVVQAESVTIMQSITLKSNVVPSVKKEGRVDGRLLSLLLLLRSDPQG